MDLFHITGRALYLEAVQGFVDVFARHFMHVGGTVAIKEWKLYPPGSYYIDTTGEDPHGELPGHNKCSLTSVSDSSTCWHSTGETCGQVCSLSPAHPAT